jgi:ferrochelatase
MEGINDHPKYIEALADQVLDKLDHEVDIEQEEQTSKKVSA